MSAPAMYLTVFPAELTPRSALMLIESVMPRPAAGATIRDGVNKQKGQPSHASEADNYSVTIDLWFGQMAL